MSFISCDFEDENSIACHPSSAISFVGGCLWRLGTGDWAKADEDILVVFIVAVIFLVSWQITYYMLKLSARLERNSNSSRRFSLSDRFRWRTSSISERLGGVEERNSEVQTETAEEAVSDNNSSLADTVNEPLEPPAANVADFLAAGDGWEAEEDLDYVVDEDMLQTNGGFSEDNTDDEDEDVILHRIITGPQDPSEEPEQEDYVQNEPQIDVEAPEDQENQVVLEEEMPILENVADDVMENVMTYVNNHVRASVMSDGRSSSVDLEEIVMPTPEFEPEPEPKNLPESADDENDIE